VKIADIRQRYRAGDSVIHLIPLILAYLEELEAELARIKGLRILNEMHSHD